MTPWTIDGSSAVLKLSELTGTLSLSTPQLGMRVRPSPSLAKMTCSELRILGVNSRSVADVQLIDCHIRGVDLVATYEYGSQREHQQKIYWRIHQDRVPIGIEVIVGVQTSQLHSHPFVGVESAVPKTDLEKCFLPDDLNLVYFNELGYAEMSPASSNLYPNVSNECVGQDWVTKIRWLVLDEFMEKGVIRVARVMAVVIPRNHSLDLLRSIHADYSSSEIPLTA